MEQENEMLEVLKLIAPGTRFREGLENVLKARTGGLIVVGDSEEILNIVDGGFEINREYSPALLYELAKMDGAIIISKDLKKILYANTQLSPNINISTNETGTRHRTAERVAKQTGELVISVSQRRNVITLFKGEKRYLLPDTSVVLTRANQALQTLEKYKTALDGVMNNLNALEFEDIVTLENVCIAIQKVEMVLKIANEVERYICELGDESRLVEMQLEELLGNTKVDLELIVKDYLKDNRKSSEKIVENIKSLSYSELSDYQYLSKLLGYSGVSQSDIILNSKGYRILSMLPRMPASIIENLVAEFKDLKGVINASIGQLDDVDGIGEIRAKNISDGLKRMREQTLFDIRF